MKIGKAYILEVQNVLAKIYVGNFFFIFIWRRECRSNKRKHGEGKENKLFDLLL